MKKKLFAWLLALCMLVGLLPVTALPASAATTKTVTYTITDANGQHNGVNGYINVSATGDLTGSYSLQITDYNLQDIDMSWGDVRFHASCTDSSFALFGSGTNGVSGGQLSTYNRYKQFTMTFSSETWYITKVELYDAQGIGLWTGEGVDKSLSLTSSIYNLDAMLLGIQRFKITLSDVKPTSTYKLNYVLNGGDNAAGNPDTYDDDKVTALAAPTRTGYSFGGWYDNAACTGTAYAEIPVGASGDLTLYAKWTVNQYTVQFLPNYGSGTMADQTFTYDGEPQALTANAYTRTGYSFTGWNTRRTGDGDAYTDGQEVQNLVDGADDTFLLYAQWSKNSYTVTLDPVDGQINAGNVTGYTYGDRTQLPTDVTRFGYDFGGWYESSAYTGKPVSEIRPTDADNKAYYAKWTPTPYPVSYVLSGGTNAAANPDVYTCESGEILLADPIRTGYSFGGWYGNEAFTAPADTSIPAGSTGDWTLYAKWTANSYTVNFYGNGAEDGSMASQSFTYDAAQRLTANAFMLTGYHFAGWNTKADGSGEGYTDGQSVQNLAAENGAQINLYAQWAPNPYTVHFDPNGVNYGEMADQSFTYDEPAKALTANTFHATAARFLGWNTEPDGTGDDYADGESVQNLTAENDATVTLYAQWEWMQEVNYNTSIFNCTLVGDANQIYRAFAGETVQIAVTDSSSVYTIYVTRADGTDIRLSDSNTFTMPDQEVYITASSVKKIAYTYILIDCTDFDDDMYSDPAYLYDADHPTVTPTIIVKDGQTVLTEGVDYSLEITNNTGSPDEQVIATVTVTGMGDYVGIKTDTFRITPFNVADCIISGKRETYQDGYNGGEPLAQSVQVRYGDTQLVSGDDYYILTSDDYLSFDPGQTYTGWIVGMGEWIGTKAFTFGIKELKHTLVYDANGGTGTMEDDAVVNLGEYVGYRYYLPMCAFTAPEGKVFDHWHMIGSDDPDDQLDKQPGDYFSATYIWDESFVTTITARACWRDKAAYTLTLSGLDGASVLVNGTAASLTEGAVQVFETDLVTVVTGENAEYSFPMPASDLTVTAASLGAAHSISVDNDLKHGAVASSAAQASAGDAVTLTVTPGAGYGLNALFVNGVDVTGDVANNQYSLTMPAADVSVTANFKRVFTLTIDPAITNGTVTAHTQESGLTTTVTLTAIPDDGYALDSLTVRDDEGNLLPLTGNSFAMPASNVSVTASFKHVYPVTVSAGIAHGTVTANIQSAMEGADVLLTVTPDAGYLLEALTVNGKAIASNSFAMPEGGAAVSASFRAIDYEITVDAAITDGSVEANVPTAHIGESVTLTITAANGYRITDLTVTDAENNDVPVTGNSFTMPASNVSVSACFAPLYSVTVANGITKGTVTANAEETICGETVTLTVTPSAGCTLVALTVTDADGDAVPVTNNRFTMPASDVTVTAVFDRLYNVTVEDLDPHGTVTADVSRAVPGKLITLTVTPDSGYIAEAVFVEDDNGNPVPVTDNRFLMPEGNVTVSVWFERGSGATFDEFTGILTLRGYVERMDLDSYRSEARSIVCEPGTVLPYDCSGLFSDFWQVRIIDLSNADTSRIHYADRMFAFCSRLSAIYVSSSWNLSKVVDSHDMFMECFRLVGGNGTRCTDHNELDYYDPGDPNYDPYDDPYYMLYHIDPYCVDPEFYTQYFGYLDPELRHLLYTDPETFYYLYLRNMALNGSASRAVIDRLPLSPGYLTGVYSLTLPEGMEIVDVWNVDRYHHESVSPFEPFDPYESFNGRYFAGAHVTIHVRDDYRLTSEVNFGENTDAVSFGDGYYDIWFGNTDITVTATLEKKEPKYVANSLTLEGQIGENFIVNLDGTDPADAFVTFTWDVKQADGTFNTNTQTVYLSDLEPMTETGYEGCFKVPVKVSAKEMGDSIHAALTINGQTYEGSYSVQSYAKTILSDEYRTAYLAQNHTEEEYNRLAALIRTMLIYGAAAQQQFGYNTGSLVTNDTPAALADGEIAELHENQIGALPTGVTFAGSSLLLKAETVYRLYFTVESGKTLTVTRNGATLTAKPKGSYYYVEIAGIAAKDILNDVTLEVNGVACTFNAGDYIKDVLSDKAIDEATMTLKNTVTALYRYCMAARAYFGVSFQFTNSLRWNSIYFYAWDANDHALQGAWPGALLTDSEINGYGEAVFTVQLPTGTVGVVLSNGDSSNNQQTVDITDFFYTGYYPDGTTDGSGHYNVVGWSN